MKRRAGREDWEDYILGVLNDPKGGISLYYAGSHVALLLMLFLLGCTMLVSVLLGLRGTFYYLMVVSGVLALILSNYAAPTRTKDYLSDFKKFETMPPRTKRRYAVVTLLTVVGIWVFFIFSFAVYLRFSVAK